MGDRVVIRKNPANCLGQRVENLGAASAAERQTDGKIKLFAPMDAKQMPIIGLYVHHFKCGSDVHLSQPCTATCGFDEGYGLVDVMIVHVKFLERDETVNAWEWGIVGGREIYD